MDFQQLLRQLADEHRRLERERNELSEEVSRLRQELCGGRAVTQELTLEEVCPLQPGPPGQVALPAAAPAGADSGEDQAGVVTVRALAARRLRSGAAGAEGHFVSVSVGAGLPAATSTRQGPDAEWSSFTAGLPAQPHQRTLELRVLESPGGGGPPRSVGDASIEFRSLPPGRWQRRTEALPADGGLVECEVRWQPGGDGEGALARGGGGERSAPVRARARHLTETEWLDDKEQMKRARQKVRFLDVFGVDVSQQHTHTITAENLGEVLAKRGLRNIKDGFLSEALLELARVSPPMALTRHVSDKSIAFSSIMSGREALAEGDAPRSVPRRAMSGHRTGIGFEAFVNAVLMPDLPKRVQPRLSRGVEKMQEALLKQDVEEVIARLSRNRESMSVDMPLDGASPMPRSLWIARVDTALNVVVTLTVIASIFCLAFRRESNPHWEGWIVLEVVFAVVFVAEIVLKVLMHGSHMFWCGPERKWNWLDFAVTVISVGDAGLNLIAQNLSDDFDFSRIALVGRALRLMRLGRVLKMIRSPLIRELSNMLIGFVLGSPALFWVFIIISVVVALLAMSLRIAVGPPPGEDVLIGMCGHPDSLHITEDTDPACAKHMLYAEEYCGSLSKCMFTVFRCMIGDCSSSGGQSLAAHLSAGFGFKFDVVYLTGMIVMIFGLFNVITAIFVEATMAGLKYNEAKQKLRLVYEHQYVKRKLEELVRRIQSVSRCVQNSDRRVKDGPTDTWGMSEDPDSADNINLTENEFFAVIEDNVVRRILMELDIEIEGAGEDTLFEMSDSNNSGTVDVASLIDTLMKLRGGPMKVDMIAPSVALRGLQQELRRLGARLAAPAAADPAGGGASPKASARGGAVA